MIRERSYRLDRERAGRSGPATRYYGQPAAVVRKRQAVFGGPPAAAAAWLRGYAEAGVSDLIVRFTGDHDRQLDAVAALRSQLG
jgi:hypothetical protein